MQIQATKQYNKFKLVPGNRNINQAHLRNLTTSIVRNNMLSENPIIVNEKMEVVDGQHRLEVCRLNSLDVYYVVKKGAGLSAVQTLNAYNKSWSMSDYLDSYCSLGYGDYLILKQFCQENKLSITNGALMLADKLVSRGADGFRRNFKMGEFKVVNLEKALEMVGKVQDLKQYIGDGVWNDREFIYAAARMYESADHKELISKFNQSGYKVERAATVRDYLRQFEEIYNFKKANRTRFF